MKFIPSFFVVLIFFTCSAHGWESTEVAKCMDLPDNEYFAQLDCLDPVLEKAKTDLDSAYRAKIESFNGDKKATKALEKQHKDWKKKLTKSCGEATRPQELGYVEGCKIEATYKRTAELSK